MRCFTQVRIFLTFFLVGSVGFIKKNCFLIRQPEKKKEKKKVHIGFPSRAHQRLDGVGGRGGWQKGLGLGKGDGVLHYRSDLRGGDFLIAGKNY